jgi:hypothetical protein
MLATRRRGKCARALLASVALGWVLGFTGPAAAGEDAMRLSGTVLAVDAGAATVTIEELGAAATPTGTPSPRTRTVRLAPVTAIRLLQRQPGATETTENGWPGGFAATPLAVSDLRPGDFATVLLDRRDAREVASSIDVIRDVIRPTAESRSTLERVASSTVPAPTQ